MKNMKSLTTAALALAIAIGGGAWATQYAFASADDAPAAQEKAKVTKHHGAMHPGKKGGPAFGGMDHGKHIMVMKHSDELLTLLGMTAEELKEAVKSGKSLAEIAKEKGVDVQAVIGLHLKPALEGLDKQLANGKLTQEQYDKLKANLTDKITKMVKGELGGLKGEAGQKGEFGLKVGPGMMSFHEKPIMIMKEFEGLATLLGMTTDELKEAVKSGKSLADIAKEKNVDAQAVIDFHLKSALEGLDKHLADGKLTQEQYDKLKANLTDKITKMVNGELGGLKGDIHHFKSRAELNGGPAGEGKFEKRVLELKQRVGGKGSAEKTASVDA